ncbi:MAG: AI-2E family transporter [Methanosarcinaceae archaeon]|nr:AI-2E family transporter [Methanosarcinaceae archaeon]
MTLSTNRNVWAFLALITLFFIGLFATLFYFRDLFIILIFGAVLIVISEKLLSFFDRVKLFCPGLNKKSIGFLLFLFGTLGLLFLVSKQLNTLGILLTDIYEMQRNYANGSLAFSTGEGKGFLLSELSDSKLFEPESLQKLGNSIFSEVASLFSKISYFLFTGILIIPLMFSMYFRHSKKIEEYIHEYIPLKYAKGTTRALKGIGRKLEDFLFAKLTESAIVGLICCTGFYFSGLKGWFFLGLLAGFLNIIPYIGPIMGMIPPLILGYMESPTTAFFVGLTGLGAQLVDNLYLIPFMISEKVNLNPLLSVLLTLSASKLFGPLGMVLAIPIYITYKIIVTEFYRELVRIYPEKE